MTELPEHEVLKLDEELLPHVITPLKLCNIKRNIYEHSIKHEVIQSWIHNVWPTSVLVLKESCRQHLDVLILKIIFSYALPPCSSLFDARTDTVDDDDDDDNYDCYDKPDDACSDNGFEGGFNAVAGNIVTVE